MRKKFPPDSAVPQHIWLSDDARFAVTAGFDEKQLQVWKLDFGRKAAVYGHLVSMKHAPIVVECRNNFKEENSLALLAITEKGFCYVWNFETVSDEVAKPTEITVKATNEEIGGRTKTMPVIAARILGLDRDAHLRAFIAYGSVESPEFTSVDISRPGRVIVHAKKDNIALLELENNNKRQEKSVEETKRRKKREEVKIDDGEEQSIKNRRTKHQMEKQNLKSLVTAFTKDGEYLAILSPDGTVRVNTGICTDFNVPSRIR